MRDGRLAGSERASFERHAVACPACSRELQALEDLAGKLRAGPPASADELHVRRERTRVLAAFDQVLVSAEGHRSPRRVSWLVAAAAVLVGLLVLWRVRPDARPAQASNAVVHAEAGAVWSEQLDEDHERILLERGALWIHVDHSSSQRRLLVVLPDGELEDRGTTFTIGADGARTTRVAVEDGHVVLRLHGRPSVSLGPGDTWTADVPAPVACASVAPPPVPVSPAPAEVTPGAASPRAAAPIASTQAPDPAADFRAAMDAFDAGDHLGAAARFQVFLQKHPRDPRAEDAAYLRIIALQRSGDRAGTKQATTEYLRRYPTGFRQAEVEHLAQ
jgi:hypothetical protein